MRRSSRRFLWLALAFSGGAGLLLLLMVLVTRPAQPTAQSAPPPAATPHVVATVDDEPILFSEWQQAVRLDEVMSALLGQTPSDPDQTLQRLVNEHLVLRAADQSGLPQPDRAQAEAWLASFLFDSGVDSATLEQELSQAGLTRTALVMEIVPRLLRVQQALEELPPDGDGEAWVVQLRQQAQVDLLR
jgi:hypothetical protein